MQFCKTAYHDLQRRHGDSRQDIDGISWEIPSLLGPFIEPISPPRVHHLFSCVLVQNYQVSFKEAEEPRFFSHCKKPNHWLELLFFSKFLRNIKSICLPLSWAIYLPGFGLSWRVTTYLDRFLSPSRKVTTRSRISSALLEVKVYSSPLIVARVKLCPCSFPPLGCIFIGDKNMKHNEIQRQNLKKD